MRAWTSLLVLVACGGGGDAPADDTDVDTDVVDDDPPDSDTAVPWDGDSDGADFTRDTFPVTDDPIEPTALDGTWTGTFSYTEVNPLGLKDPHCDGTITLVVDGRAARHVVADLTCDTWDPNTALGKPYGTMTGIGFGTLDPANLARFFVDASLGAKNMPTASLPRIKVVPTDDHLIGSFDDVVGIGTLKAGRKLDFDVVRPAP